MAALGDGFGDVAYGAAEWCDLFLDLFGDSFIFRGEFGDCFAVLFEEGLQVVRVFKKRCEVLDDCFFKRDGWDGLKVTGAVAFGAGAGVAAIVGPVTLA